MDVDKYCEYVRVLEWSVLVFQIAIQAPSVYSLPTEIQFNDAGTSGPNGFAKIEYFHHEFWTYLI